MKRRTILAQLAAMTGISAVNGFSNSGCDQTASIGDGPFYPQESIPAQQDLTRTSSQGKATGQVLYVFGQVTNPKCEPIRDARVEIWQCDSNGRYKHPRAGGQDQLDPNFRYFAHAITDADGRYMFKTLEPVAYGGRTPHIHFKIRKDGRRLISTEMNFMGDEEKQARDGVFLSTPADMRHTKLVEKKTPDAFASMDYKFEKGSICSRFNLVVG